MRSAPRPRRRWDVRCEKCGYPLWQLEEPGCPECGHGRSKRRLAMHNLARSTRNLPHPDTRHCRQCGYLLRGTDGPYCPSCNALVDFYGRVENDRRDQIESWRHQRSEAALRRGFRLARTFAIGAWACVLAMGLRPDWPRPPLIVAFLWQAAMWRVVRRGVRGEGWIPTLVCVGVGVLAAGIAWLG